MTNKQRDADIAYLLRRANKAGICSFTEDRDCGISSNALVRFAYTGKLPKSNQWPIDASDLRACKLAVRRLPKHRKSEKLTDLLRGFAQGLREQNKNG